MRIPNVWYLMTVLVKIVKRIIYHGSCIDVYILITDNNKQPKSGIF